MVTLKKHPNALEIIPDDLESLADCTDLYDAMEVQTCNGWDWIAPEEVGALTCGKIITDDSERDDNGNLVKVGRVYWNSAYEVESTLEELQAGRSVYWIARD